MKRVLIYTAVFEGYDRVLPPVWQRPGLTYHLLTDDPKFQVNGWETVPVSGGANPKIANRQEKFMYKVGSAEYDYIVYIDGNIGIWRNLDPLIEEFEKSGAALAVFRHPDRAGVTEELLACVASGKISEEDFVREQREFERQLSSPEGARLWAAGCLIKDNSSPEMECIMRIWSDLFSLNALRDQFWLGEAVLRSGGSIIEFEHWSKAFVPRLVKHRHRRSEGLLGLVYFKVAAGLMSALRFAKVYRIIIFGSR